MLYVPTCYVMCTKIVIRLQTGQGRISGDCIYMLKTHCLFVVTSYYCPSGSKYVKPDGFHCTVGHYCPGGVPEPIPCPNNSYVNRTHAEKCDPCPAGFYCVIAGTTVQCREGESFVLWCICYRREGIVFFWICCVTIITAG